MSLPQFMDFVEHTDKPFIGDKVKINDVLDKDIIVEKYKIGESNFAGKYNNESCLTIQFKFLSNPETPHILFTGSSVLIDQCNKYGDKMPFQTKIVKNNKYFSFN